MSDIPPRNRPIYLDHQSTTPVDPRVLAVMLPFFTHYFGNPHSPVSIYGREAKTAVEQARGVIAGALGADPREILFTSGATESDNLAIAGAARFRRDNRDRRDHILTIATEHKSVLETVRALERQGFQVQTLGVDAEGEIDLDDLRKAVTDRTALVSVMAANNEIGVVHPLVDIGAICRAKGAWFHTNAAQAVGKVPLDTEAMQIDLMSISGHKLYGPKGIGALYVRRRPRVRLEPLLHGAGQEGGSRPGTLATPLCVGLGEAVALACAEMGAENERLDRLRSRLVARLTERIPDLRINGPLRDRLAGNLNIAVPGVGAEGLLAELDGKVAISAGSACGRAALEPSHVLRALGLDDMTAAASVRLGLGRANEERDIDEASAAIAEAVSAIRGDRATRYALPTRN